MCLYNSLLWVLKIYSSSFIHNTEGDGIVLNLIYFLAFRFVYYIILKAFSCTTFLSICLLLYFSVRLHTNVYSTHLILSIYNHAVCEYTDSMRIWQYVMPASMCHITFWINITFYKFKHWMGNSAMLLLLKWLRRHDTMTNITIHSTHSPNRKKIFSILPHILSP